MCVQSKYNIFVYNELSLIINNITFIFIISNIIKIIVFLVIFKIQPHVSHFVLLILLANV